MIWDNITNFFRGLLSAQRMLNLQDEQMAKQVREALNRAYTAAQKQTPYLFDLARDRYIIFSDFHRGARDAADDFRRAETAYTQALSYYFQGGYTLVVNGDVEELWENAPGPVLKAYPQIFQAEAQFQQQGRYIRLWGNHDKDWRKPREVQKHLQPLYGETPPLDVRESALIQVSDQGQLVGTLFLVHGHQGTLESDRLAWLARPVVRYIWRPIQNLTKISPNSPAHDWRLARGLDHWLSQWVTGREKMVLIAGHTHHPVFYSQADPAGNIGRPCYFNSGCCCFSDGTITGLEISGGQIRLIRWSSTPGQAEPEVLDQTSLHNVFARC